MHTQWLRGFRAAAYHASKRPLTVERSFHASAARPANPSGAPSPDDNGNNKNSDNENKDKSSPPGDSQPHFEDAKEVDKDADSSAFEAGRPKDENIFGESPPGANGDTQGRKSRGGNGGSLRSRILRNRPPEEMPPVVFPKGFKRKAFRRLEDMRAKAAAASEPPFAPIWESSFPYFDIMAEASKYSKQEQFDDDWCVWRLSAALWSEESVQAALKSMAEGKTAHIRRRGELLTSFLYWEACIASHRMQPLKPITQIEQIPYGFYLQFALARYKMSMGALETSSPDHDAHGPEFVPPETTVSMTDSTHGENPASGLGNVRTERRKVDVSRGKVSEFIERIVHDDYMDNIATLLTDPYTLEEALAAVKAEFVMVPPKHVRSSDVHRRVTVLNFPQDILGKDALIRYLGAASGADVLHLHAWKIASIIGRYLGQDAVRNPSPISQLGYKTALISGNLKSRRVESPEDYFDEMVSERASPLTVAALLMPHDMSRGDSKRMTNNGKVDDLWEDLKINKVIDELLHIAGPQPGSERPLIVHINDFNALNMDAESGAMIINKLRQAVDGLWSEGRKIALVGTSHTTSGAPKAYVKAMKELEETHHVVHLHPSSPRSSEIRTLESICRRSLSIAQNFRHLKEVLLSLLDPLSEDKAPQFRIDSENMRKIALRKFSPDWGYELLTLKELYRISTTMIGLEGISNMPYTIDTVRRTTTFLNHVEERKPQRSSLGQIPKDRSETEEEKVERQESRREREDHEEKLLSGLINAEDIKTTFSDVHAPKETIESVKMLTTLSLIRPEAFSYGVLATDRIPGCLLYGPPGTGKTLLAKAVAKESGANMIEVSGASINNMFVGESEKNVRALFRLAKKKEPLVIFIDEADALLGARGQREGGARRETINQFLREWDGMDTGKAFIMVATNRPFDLDEAVLRRLPRKLLIDLPLESDRAAILRIHLKGETLGEEVSIEQLAKKTQLYSGSDLKNLCVAAAMAAVKEQLDAEAARGAESGGGEHDGEQPHRRVLAQRHFDKALGEIGASVSEDMASLAAIKKFDERYGDAGGRKPRKKGMGFGGEEAKGEQQTEAARVRQGRKDS